MIPFEMPKNIPQSYPTFLVKCMWRSTAVTLKIRAKDELGAWDIAAKQVKRMFGGMSCLEIKILGCV